jgi:hypothetical protein
MWLGQANNFNEFIYSMIDITLKQLRALVAVASEVSLTREDALFSADHKKNSGRVRERH